MSSDANGTGWLYRRLDAASAEVDRWTEEKKRAINYVFHAEYASPSVNQAVTTDIIAERGVESNSKR